MTNSKGGRKKFGTDNGALKTLKENQVQKAIKITIANLQKCWKCSIHSKDKKKYC